MLTRIAVLAAIVPCLLASAAYAAAPIPTTFGYTSGEQTYTVPAGVTSVRLTATGAPGGAGAPGPNIPGVAGGLGALVTGDLAVTPGEVLYVEIGGPGGDGNANGGGLPVSTAAGWAAARSAATARSAGAAEVRPMCGSAPSTRQPAPAPRRPWP